jgi:hypothetical protein
MIEFVSFLRVMKQGRHSVLSDECFVRVQTAFQRSYIGGFLHAIAVVSRPGPLAQLQERARESFVG